VPGPRGARDGGYVLSPQLVELGLRAATAAQQERLGERLPALSPVLPQARLTGEAFSVRLAPQQLQPIMGRLSVFLVLHRGASVRN
jgi:hypothetical protein